MPQQFLFHQNFFKVYKENREEYRGTFNYRVEHKKRFSTRGTLTSIRIFLLAKILTLDRLRSLK